MGPFKFTWTRNDQPHQYGGRYCTCSIETWADFRDKVADKFSQLPGILWLVDEVSAVRPHRDLRAQPNIDFLLGGAFAYNVPEPGTPEGQPPANVDSVVISWKGDLLTVDAHLRSGHREMHLRALDGRQAIVADTLREAGSIPADVTPAHYVTTYDSDVVHTTANLLVTAGYRNIDELLTRLTDMKTTTAGPAWETIVHLSDGWRGALEDLVNASGAILQPAD